MNSKMQQGLLKMLVSEYRLPDVLITKHDCFPLISHHSSQMSDADNHDCMHDAD